MRAENDDGRRYGFISDRLELDNYLPPVLIKVQFKIELNSVKDSQGRLD
ncbi:hypothetical protein [Paenisporosarcina sp. OV554]|nr:hypothetical protein [Paenisporosarcina sp. OV554]